MKTILVLIISILISVDISIAQSWNQAGSAGFSEGEAFSQSIALDGETPYVAYMDRANGDKVTVMKFNGLSWEAVGAVGFTEGEASSINIAISNGIPYVAFTDEANENKATVMKFNGSNWVNAGQAGFSSGRATSIALAMNKDIPFVAFIDNMQYNKMTVMKLNDEGWTVLGSAGFTNGSVSVISLAFDDEKPFVSYRDSETDMKASVMTFNETNWEQVGIKGFSGGTHDANKCLAVAGGIPYVASWDSNAKAAVYKFDGTNWAALGSSDISVGQANYASIDISDAGILYLAFSDLGNMGKLVVKKFVDGNWEEVGDAASPGDVSNINVAVSNNGIPFVAYRDHWFMRRTSVVQYSNVTKITDLIDNPEFSIYPNPSNGKFTIESVDLKSQNFNIEIINQLGQVVLYKQSGFSQRIKIDLSGSENGIYNVKLKNQNKELSKTVIINK
jgi:hypothetical protein